MCNHRYPTGCSSIDIFGPVQENNFSFPFLRKSKNPGGRSKVQEAEVGAGGAVGPESEGPKEATGVQGAGGGCREVGEACLGAVRSLHLELVLSLGATLCAGHMWFREGLGRLHFMEP